MLHEELYKIARLAALEASRQIMKVYSLNTFGLELKTDNSPITIADKVSHDTIFALLSKTGLPILSEEGLEISYETRKTWDFFWLVDPLDGTKEFIKKNGEFTVNIALMHHNKPVWGVICVPASNTCYYGGRGQGAHLDLNGKVDNLSKKAREVNLSAPGLRVVVSRSHLNERTQSFVAGLNEPQMVSVGSSLKFMLLAEGKADIYPRFSPTMEWDTAAAHAILNELGFDIFIEDTNQPLAYNKSNLLNPGFIAS